jgi:hypothetical protein
VNAETSQFSVTPVHQSETTFPQCGTTDANPPTMQTPFPEPINPVTLFSRERRRQRMLQFLETFERRSWPCAQDFPFIFPLAKDDLREPSLTVHEEAHR